MKLQLQRFLDDGLGTLGILFADKDFECFTVEDTFRAKKIKGKTRIPNGTYRIKLREVLSEKTKKYRKSYNWFTWHIELQDVPGFKYVYIHIGNNATHSEGCILVGATANKFGNSGPEALKSAIAFKPLYLKIREALERNEEVSIEIKETP